MCHDMVVWEGKPSIMERVMIMQKYMAKEELKDRERQEYVNGLKRFEAKGVPVFIDGEKPGEEDWKKIFEIREDGSFYMGDYIGADEGALREIRFDRVYNR